MAIESLADEQGGHQWHRATIVESAELRKEEETTETGFQLSDHAISERRSALLSLLRARRIPVSEPNPRELLVLGCLRVVEPYTFDACSCENEVVLARFYPLLSELDRG